MVLHHSIPSKLLWYPALPSGLQPLVLAGTCASLPRAVAAAEELEKHEEPGVLEQRGRRDMERKHRDTELDYSHDLLIFRLKKEPHSLKLR